MIQAAFYGTAFTDCEMKESKKGSEYATLLALTSNGADEQPVPQASEAGSMQFVGRALVCCAGDGDGYPPWLRRQRLKRARVKS